MTFLRTLLLFVGFCGASFAADAPNTPTEVVQILDGKYRPDPRKCWFTGEVITISGSRFRWTHFTDVTSHTPSPQEGQIKIFGDHIVLDGLRWNPKRIPAVLDGVPVLWTEEGHAEWKKSGKIKELCILYLEKK